MSLFVGAKLDAALRSHLTTQPPSLTVAICDGKEYVGLYCDGSLPLSELDALEEKVRQALVEACPEIDLDQLSIYLFPQQMIQ